MKGKKPAKKAGPTATAKAAGCSKSQAHKLLQRGLSKPEIVQRTKQRKAREEGKAARGNGYVNGHDPDELPTVPVPPFSESEARKEFHLASIRELQASKLRGTVLPVEPWRSVIFASTRFLTNRLRDLPDELADELGPALVTLLRIRIDAIFDESRRVLAWECQRCGVPPPPVDAPEPVRRRLAYYERFLRDSRNGEVEVIPVSERIESKEWRDAHPSISFERAFGILAAKRRWDEDMLALLRRRAEWDLPSETPEPPPPEKDAT